MKIKNVEILYNLIHCQQIAIHFVFDITQIIATFPMICTSEKGQSSFRRKEKIAKKKNYHFLFNSKLDVKKSVII